MSTKKKSTIPQPFKKYNESGKKPTEPKALYSVDQKVFMIVSHKGKPEKLNEGKIFAVKSRKIADIDYLGKKIGTKTRFTYQVCLPNNGIEEIFETSLYPNYIEAAK